MVMTQSNQTGLGKIERLEQSAGSNGHDLDRDDPDGVMARVLREALRTPAYREMLRLHVNEFQASEGPSLVRSMLREDPELWLSLAGATPRLMDSVVQSLAALGTELSAMPDPLVDSFLTEMAESLDHETLRSLPLVWAPLLARGVPGALNLAFASVAGVGDSLVELSSEKRSAALKRALSGLDTAQAGRALNAVVELVLAAHRDSPDLFSSAEGLDWSPLLREVDSGRLREAVVALSAAGREGAESVLAEVLGDPVIVANLVGILPALLNDGVGLLSHVVAGLSLPDEVLASAIFNVLRALDVHQVGRLSNDIAGTINTLHLGSAILGLEEPAFQRVFVELVNDLLDTLDLDAVSRAAVALGEDADVMAQVIARRLATDPGLLDQSVDTLAKLLDLGVQTALHMMRELAHLPPGTREVVTKRLGELNGRAAGELCNHGLDLLESSLSAAEGAPALAAFSEAVDRERVRRVFWKTATPMVRTAVAELWQEIARNPARISHEINGALVRFNAFLQERPAEADGFLTRAFGDVDRRELSRAWRGGVRLLGRSVFSTGPSTGRLRPWLEMGARAVAKPAWRNRNRGAEGRR